MAEAKYAIDVLNLPEMKAIYEAARVVVASMKNEHLVENVLGRDEFEASLDALEACDCGHIRADHPDDGACIHGDGDDGCIQYQRHASPNRSDAP